MCLRWMNAACPSIAFLSRHESAAQKIQAFCDVGSFRAMQLPFAATGSLGIASTPRFQGFFHPLDKKILWNGAAKKNRTSDPVITNDVLYH
jgi:hypothetical protein